MYGPDEFLLKLLGSDSNDIDVALEGMMGHPFAVDFAEFLSNEKQLVVKTVAKVKENPNQSKHLETAKTSVLGLDLDFVNLRAEEYADHSRIPTTVVSLRCLDVLFRYERKNLGIRYSSSRRPPQRHHYKLIILQRPYSDRGGSLWIGASSCLLPAVVIDNISILL